MTGAESWKLFRSAVSGFVDDDALSRGAAMSFFAVTSLAPILLIVVAIAGLAFGREAAGNALASELSGVMGKESAEILQVAIRSAANPSSGILATIVGLVTLLAAASGVFGEMQATLNRIWRVETEGSSVSRMVRARAASLGLVTALGFLLIVSLAASAAITSLGDYVNARLPFGAVILRLASESISLVLIAVLFAAIYKVLPDRSLAWRDVVFGALVTAVLFVSGKSLIGAYLGSSGLASSYGAAGGLILIMLWVYYSSLIFLFGAELTRAYSLQQGSRRETGLAPKTVPAG